MLLFLCMVSPFFDYFALRNQRWIASTLKLCKITSLGYLSDADSYTFLRFHDMAVVSLVMGTDTIDADTIPETLLLDRRRLRALQGDFRSIVTCAAVLVLVNQAVVGSDKEVSPAKHSVLIELVKLLTGGSLDVLDDFFAECVPILDSAGVLMDTFSRKSLFEAIRYTASSRNDDDRIRQLM